MLRVVGIAAAHSDSSFALFDAMILGRCCRNALANFCVFLCRCRFIGMNAALRLALDLSLIRFLCRISELAFEICSRRALFQLLQLRHWENLQISLCFESTQRLFFARLFLALIHAFKVLLNRDLLCQLLLDALYIALLCLLVFLLLASNDGQLSSLRHHIHVLFCRLPAKRRRPPFPFVAHLFVLMLVKLHPVRSVWVWRLRLVGVWVFCLLFEHLLIILLVVG